MRLFELFLREAAEDDRQATIDRIVALHRAAPQKWRDPDDGRETWKGPQPQFARWLATLAPEDLARVQASWQKIADYANTPKTRAQKTADARLKAVEARRRSVLADLLSRAPKTFDAWLRQSYSAAEVKANQTDPAWRLAEFETWLTDLSVRVRDDGLIEFWSLADGVQTIIGDNEVALFHYTSSRVVPSIKREGLDADRAPINGTKFAAVYLTCERSGPPITGYLRNAVRAHGGKPVCITVRVRLADVQPDPDDADIRSGGHQFVIAHCGPERIVSVQPYRP